MSSKKLAPALAYDLWADTYDSDPNPMIALSGEVLAQHDTLFNRVLEFGCGTGRNLLALRNRGAVVFAGVDVSEGMLTVARRRIPAATFWCQDARAPVQSEGASFDLVLVSLVLEHIEDPAPVFDEAARLLAPGGTLMVIELHPNSYAAGSRARFEDQDGNKHFTTAWPHTAEELQACALAAGFSPSPMEDVFPSRELLERFPSRRAAGNPWLLKGAWVRP